MTDIKGTYPDTDSVRKKFKPQASMDTCFPTSIQNSLNEFLEREGIVLKVSSKEIKNTLFKKGPFGQIALRPYTKNLSGLLKGEQIRSIETYHQPSLIPTDGPVSDIVDLVKLSSICQSKNMSFPYVSVSGRWFEEMGIDSWADPDNVHVITVIDVDIDKGEVYFFDPAEKFILRSSRVTHIPKHINSDRFFSYWDEHKVPRQVGWFERIQKPLTEW